MFTPRTWGIRYPTILGYLPHRRQFGVGYPTFTPKNFFQCNKSELSNTYRNGVISEPSAARTLKPAESEVASRVKVLDESSTVRASNVSSVAPRSVYLKEGTNVWIELPGENFQSVWKQGTIQS